MTCSWHCALLFAPPAASLHLAPGIGKEGRGLPWDVLKLGITSNSLEGEPELAPLSMSPGIALSSYSQTSLEPRRGVGVSGHVPGPRRPRLSPLSPAPGFRSTTCGSSGLLFCREGIAGSWRPLQPLLAWPGTPTPAAFLLPTVALLGPGSGSRHLNSWNGLSPLLPFCPFPSLKTCRPHTTLKHKGSPLPKARCPDASGLAPWLLRVLPSCPTPRLTSLLGARGFGLATQLLPSGFGLPLQRLGKRWRKRREAAPTPRKGSLCSERVDRKLI